MVVAVVAGIYLSDGELTELGLFKLVLMAIIFVSLAQIGDLFESALKRRADIKDSGDGFEHTVDDEPQLRQYRYQS